MNPSLKQIKEITDWFDMNGNFKYFHKKTKIMFFFKDIERINYNQFIKILKNTWKEVDAQELRSAIEVFDPVGNGYLTVDQFKNSLLSLGEALDEDDFKEIVKTVNVQPDGTINIEVDSSCDNGLCTPPSMDSANPTSAPKWTTIDWDTQSRAYGSATNAASLKGPDNEALARQPQYFIEMLPKLPPSAGESVCMGCTTVAVEKARAYRITVRAYGVRDTTVVMLQSVYVKQ